MLVGADCLNGDMEYRKVWGRSEYTLCYEDTGTIHSIRTSCFVGRFGSGIMIPSFY